MKEHGKDIKNMYLKICFKEYILTKIILLSKHFSDYTFESYKIHSYILHIAVAVPVLTIWCLFHVGMMENRPVWVLNIYFLQ